MCPWQSLPSRSELPCQNAFMGLDLNRGFGNSISVVRKDLAGIDFQGFFFLAAHQVDVELCHANFAQGLEFLAVLLDGADEAEAVDNCVGDKISIIAADFAMMQVVILT